jgi:hypothetical protein
MLEYSPQESRLQTERKASLINPPLPPYRKLRGYAFDPSLSLEMNTAAINEVVYKVRWEEPLEPGPIGEYLEVVDYDPASGVFYHPVDLNNPYLLAQDGLDSSEGNPQFHQQMVYAVAMTTIQNMERALGRWIFWNSHREMVDANGKKQFDDAFVRRLRLYPHALREANAFYSPDKKAILFGYFPATYDNTTGQLPGGLVFSCLSHDIIAHEMTHAILDGMHRRYVENTNPDVLAFHEAFADLVALFQHFTFPEVLYQQIAATRGNLAAENQLGKLALQFGVARGKRNSLRDALGEVGEDGEWQPKKPNPTEYETATEAHQRGNILMAALFESFVSLYNSRVSDLLRIATNGTGVLPNGALHPDLVKRLAGEAAKTARHLLNMCIRALDYCPPVDLTFGDYLRALITADYDLVPDDNHNYRLSIINAFRKRGIYPKGIKTLSPESLRWEPITDAKIALLSEDPYFQMLTDTLKRELYKATDIESRKDSFLFFEDIKRKLHFTIGDINQQAEFDKLTGLCLTPGDPIWQGEHPTFEVHSLRSARRVTPDGDTVNQAIVVLTQKRKVKADDGSDSTFRGGCTLIFELAGSPKLSYCIRKSIKDEHRLSDQLTYRSSLTESPNDRALYFGQTDTEREPFAFLHR